MASRCMLRNIPANVSGSISHPSRQANLMVRYILTGSSSYVTSGSDGVRIMWLRMSSSPRPVMSTNRSRQMSKYSELIERSRRRQSSSIVPKAVSGHRELRSVYFSRRVCTSSISSPGKALRLSLAVPNRGKVTTSPFVSPCRSSHRAKPMPPSGRSTAMSRSLMGSPIISSRQHPPTAYRWPSHPVSRTRRRIHSQIL